MTGGAGNDRLNGGAGTDSFLFDTTLDGSNVDTGIDFEAGVDRFLLEDEVFTGLSSGALPVGAFHVGPAAADADDRIIYDSGTGALPFDPDGNGAGGAVQFATLSPAPALSAGDFIVI